MTAPLRVYAPAAGLRHPGRTALQFIAGGRIRQAIARLGDDL